MVDILFASPSAIEEGIKASEAGINAAALALGMPEYISETFALQARHGDELIGNLSGRVFWNWLYVDLLWVHAEYQKQGIGTELMRRAEESARAQNLVGIYCWTQSWQAPEFYKKLGYEEFTRFENFPPGHQRFGLRKYL